MRAGDDDTIAAGTRRITGQSTPPWAALAAIGVAGALLGYLAKIPCRFGGAWVDGGQYAYACYSDIFPLYYRDGLDDGTIPYLDQPVEYPVLTGGLMHLMARAAAWLPDTAARAAGYFDLTAAVLAACLVAVVLGTGYLVGRGGVAADGGSRPFDRRAALLAGGFVALVPAAFLTTYINWDLLAVALLTGGLVGYARGWRWRAGALVGLAVAAKFYPFLFFGPLLVLTLRDLWRGRGQGVGGGVAVGDFLRTLGGAVLAWAAVNVPVLVAAPAGWAEFFEFSSERGTDWGSVFYVLGGFGLFDSGDRDLVNLTGTLSLAAACLGIAVLGLLAPRPPRLEQLLFLTVAAFLMTNKVWSPQFVLWLLPLAVLAWPRTVRPWPAVAVFVLWQLAEVGYILGIWQHLLFMTTRGEDGTASAGLDFAAYAVLSLGRLSALAVVCALVVVDCLRRGDSAS
nr:glycosyltransferase 87 family protein [Nocardiopsis mwathae]